MALAIHLILLGGACAYALRNWQRAWMVLPFLGVLQDPVRKLTTGTPVVISFLILALYASILFSARGELLNGARELSRRFPALSLAGLVFVFFLAIAAVNGFATFGVANWKLPLLSLFTYLAPLPAIVIGYVYVDREEKLYQFLRVYAVLTSIALIGTALEYARVSSPMLGLVAARGDYIRHFYGIQVRLLSGFYRSPDIMAWHAATLTAIAVAMAIRAGLRGRAFIWLAVAGGAFTTCVLSGRRKALYYVAVFCAVLIWRYARRLQGTRIIALATIFLIAFIVVRNIRSSDKTRAYAEGARTSAREVLQRLEGGVRGTIRQSGVMGAGLGMATQGTRHLAGDVKLGWQEGGLAKLTVELGLPGLIAAIVVVLRLFMVSLKLTSIGDVQGSSQFARVLLFGLIAANAANFMASAQAYSDPLLTLLTAFFGGCLFATATLDERVALEEQRKLVLAPAST